MEDEIREEICCERGIISDDGCMANNINLRINAKDNSASDHQDNTVASAYGNKFIIPLDFEMLDSAIPYHQSGLKNRLCYEITFNEDGKVIYASGQTLTLDDMYKFKDIALE